MNGILNENQLTIVSEYEFDKPLIQKIDSMFDNCIRDCHKKYFPTFDFKCVHDTTLTNFGNTENVNLTVADKT